MPTESVRERLFNMLKSAMSAGRFGARALDDTLVQFWTSQASELRKPMRRLRERSVIS
jgi:hypothetical protein